MSNLKTNFGYNLILTIGNYLIPLIVYPYISRVLGVEKIGVCNFVDSIINYFVMFSALGVCGYGVREIAFCKDDFVKRSVVFSSLFFINAACTCVAIVALVCCTFFVPFFFAYKPFLLIGVIKLVFSLFLIEWFFQGIQNFRYITLRSLLVRFAFLISVFIFVRDESDALLYYLLTVVVVVFNSLFNWIYSKKYRRFSFKYVKPKLFIVPVLSFGYYRFLTTMYTTFNVAFLGFVSGVVQVGYFTTATKLYGILLGFFSAFTTVMVPKVSQMIKDGSQDCLQSMANKTFSVLEICAFPLILYCLFCAPHIICLVAGDGYEGAILPFRIVIFLLLIIGMEQIAITQFLLAAKSSKATFVVSSVGAFVGVSFNVILTPKFGAIGSAITWGIAEFSVLLVGIVYLRRLMNISIDYKMFFKNLLFASLYLLPLVCLYYLHLSMLKNLLYNGVAVFILFVFINLVMNRNDTIAQLFNSIKIKKMK